MDADFWASRGHSSVRQLIAVQASSGFSSSSSDNHLVLNESQGDDDDDDTRALFPCPFCYVEVEVNLLCSHLQNEHCFDFKNAVCPLCAVNLGKDATKHFIAKHTNSLKRSRRIHKPHIWTDDGSPNLGRELSSCSSSKPSNRRSTDPDPLLSPFLCRLTFSDTEERIQQDKSSRSHEDSFVAPDLKRRAAPSLSDGNRIQEYKTRRQRSEFVQQLISSTIFYDMVSCSLC